MPKKPLNKTRYPFLEGSFPENPLPYKRLNRKGIRVSFLSNRKGVTSKIRNIKKSIVEQVRASKLYQKTSFDNTSSYKSLTPCKVQITCDLTPNITSITNTMTEKSRQAQMKGDVKIGQERNPSFYKTSENETVENFINKGFLLKKMYKTYQSFISKADRQISDLLTKGDVKDRTAFDADNNKPKNLYRNRIKKPLILATKYMFSLEQLKAQLYKKQSQYKKSSSFKMALLERKKCSVIYGFLGEKQIQKLLLQARYFDGKFDENFIKIVESRLDVALYRICFFPTIFSAKQWINHGHVLVNKKVITLPGYQLKAGDVISISSERKNLLKKKISFYIAKKLKIRESHYFIKVENFYTVIKNLVKYQNKNWNVYYNHIIPPLKRVGEGDRSTFLSTRLFDEKQKRIGEINIRHFEESRKLVNFFKKSFQFLHLVRSKSPKVMLKAMSSESLQKNKIIRSVYLLPKVYPFSFLFRSLTPLAYTAKQCWQITKGDVKSGVKTEGDKIYKIFSIFYPFLKVKNLFTSARPLKQRVNSYKISGMKPMNLEVCYKNMVAIFLYSPQKVALPATIDLQKIGKSF